MSKQMFVLGCPRSGTTLLSSLLKDTDYGAPVESHFIIKYFEKLSFYGDLDDKANFSRLLQDISNERAVRQWGVDIHPDELYEEITDRSYKNVVDKIFAIRSQKVGHKFWGDKTPSYILEFDKIYYLFPNAKYIYIVRDGRDVALSLLQKKWGPNNIYETAKYWMKCNRKNELLELLMKDNRVLKVKYEELLVNPVRVIADIYSYLGVGFSSRYIEELASNINRSNFDKWKINMTAHDVQMFEIISADTLKMHGYSVSHNTEKINYITEIIYKIHGQFKRMQFLFMHNVVDGVLIKYFNKEPFAE
jgi:hypothetical protein